MLKKILAIGSKSENVTEIDLDDKLVARNTISKSASIQEFVFKRWLNENGYPECMWHLYEINDDQFKITNVSLLFPKAGDKVDGLYNFFEIQNRFFKGDKYLKVAHEIMILFGYFKGCYRLKEPEERSAILLSITEKLNFVKNKGVDELKKAHDRRKNGMNADSAQQRLLWIEYAKKILTDLNKDDLHKTKLKTDKARVIKKRLKDEYGIEISVSSITNPRNGVFKKTSKPKSSKRKNSRNKSYLSSKKCVKK